MCLKTLPGRRGEAGEVEREYAARALEFHAGNGTAPPEGAPFRRELRVMAGSEVAFRAAWYRAAQDAARAPSRGRRPKALVVGTTRPADRAAQT